MRHLCALLSPKNLIHAAPKHVSDTDEIVRARRVLSEFPIANHVLISIDRARELLLRHALRFSQPPDIFTDDIIQGRRCQHLLYVKFQ